MKKQLIIFLIFLMVFADIIFPQTIHKEIKKIAVTFDDLPLNNALKVSDEEMRNIAEKLVDEISFQNIPVTAFVNENKLEGNGVLNSERVQILKMWINGGIELGNHTYSHKSANDISVGEFKEEILKGEKTITELMAAQNKKVRYFRHPYLHTGLSLEYKHEVENFLKGRGYTIAPVTIDNQEWIFNLAYINAFDSNKMDLMKIGNEYLNHMKVQIRYFEKQSEKLFGRNINQILLVHSNRLNSDYFGKVCEMIREEGYEFISLEEALKDEAYSSPDTFTDNNGISWLHRWAYTRGKQKEFFRVEPQVPEYILKIAGLQNGY